MIDIFKFLNLHNDRILFLTAPDHAPVLDVSEDTLLRF